MDTSTDFESRLASTATGHCSCESGFCDNSLHSVLMNCGVISGESVYKANGQDFDCSPMDTSTDFERRLASTATGHCSCESGFCSFQRDTSLHSVLMNCRVISGESVYKTNGQGDFSIYDTS
ncbi:hypothetical protein CEXT_410131 [Caerostris extrusa]|uniref:Uncharacterized protein n=1 Tax=Caerostris extrusa TaxID=172846 RepID=A0AAV4UVB5_CAEEX|nr:hypothetical protein CEXT_410131 [Caerostris extrusa]